MVIKTIINPIPNLRMKDGKMVHSGGKPGTFSVFSPSGLISTPTELFGERVQVVGRACEGANGVPVTAIPTLSFLVEQFWFQFNNTMKMNKTCLTSSGKVSKTWTFKEQAEIKLPIICSLSSKVINCGGTRFVTGKDRDISISSTRMEALSPTHFQERNLWANASLTISEEEDFTESLLDGIISGSTYGLSNYIWATLAGGILAAIGASCLGYLKCNTSTAATTTTPSTVPATNIQMNFTNTQEIPSAPSATSDELHANPLPYAEAV